MFWSLVLEPGKRYSSTVKESFHLSMATLDIKSCKNDSEIHPVLIEVDGAELILCNLSKSINPHANLDLIFQKGSDITFSTNGKATIHLTGYCVDDDDEEDDYDSLEDEEEEDESFSELVNNTKNASGQIKLENKSKNVDKQSASKRKLESVEAVSKKKPKGIKVETNEDGSDSDDSSVDLDDSKLDRLMHSVNTEGDSSDEDDSDFDDEDEDVEDSEGDDEVDDEEEDDDDDDDDEDEDDSEDEKPKPKQSIKQEIKTPVSNKQKTPVSSKKQEKQNKNQLTNGTTPQSNKKEKNKNQSNQPTPKQDGQKTPNKDAQKTPKKGEPSPQQPQKKQTLNGGVVVEDLKPGNGPPAKYGKMVQVYYTGRLKSNNRVFDKTTDGTGFKFRLGNGEVIKGWDVALNGMKVGGKRRITIPPGMAYGNKGSPPTIPPNSWLVFDVEMKSVN